MNILHLLFICAAADSCNKTIIVDPSKPIVIKERFNGQGTVCINTLYPNLAIVLEYDKNDYDNIKFHTTSPLAKTYGPYEVYEEIGGFYFGKNLGSVEIEFKKEGRLNLGAIVFPEACKEMILSSKSFDEVKITNDGDKEPSTGNDRTLCYWLFSLEEIKYKINVRTQKDHDFLSFVRNGTANRTYSGEMKDDFTIFPSTSSYAVWESDNSVKSDSIKIYSHASNYNYKAIKQYFKQSDDVLPIHFKYYGELDDGEIAGIVVGALIVTMIILIILCACCGCCCACCYSCCCCCWCQNARERRCCSKKGKVRDTSSSSSSMKVKVKTHESEYTPPIMKNQPPQANQVLYAPVYPVYPQYEQVQQKQQAYQQQPYRVEQP